jgi:Tol biopolymer transport system component
MTSSGQGLGGNYAASPDGSRLAYEGPGKNGRSQIFVATLDGSVVERVTNEPAAFSPAWSPDGTRIAYIDRRRGDHNIFLLDPACED